MQVLRKDDYYEVGNTLQFRISPANMWQTDKPTLRRTRTLRHQLLDWLNIRRKGGKNLSLKLDAEHSAQVRQLAAYFGYGQDTAAFLTDALEQLSRAVTIRIRDPKKSIVLKAGANAVETTYRNYNDFIAVYTR
jgi:hypothetical protein